MLVDNGAIRNHILPAVIKRIELPHRWKQDLYLLVIISGDPILYKDGIIHFETEPVKIKIEGQKVIILFNILPLSKDKAVLKMPFL